MFSRHEAAAQCRLSEKALARRKISFASATLTPPARASRRALSCCSDPSRWPVSRSYWRTQLRSVTDVQPILAAIDEIAAHCHSFSLPASLTTRTVQSMTSRESFGYFLMIPSSPTIKPLQNPGHFVLPCLGEGYWVLSFSFVTANSLLV